jgi:chorismate lyase
MGSDILGSGSILYDRAPMLQRAPSLFALGSHRQGLVMPKRGAHASWPIRPARPAMKRWLQATGSLTARLRSHGQVRVQVISQGTQRLTPLERRTLGQASGHVREVLLWVDDQAAVWARSVTSQRALRGPWKALKGLGTRPLAELLFNHQRVQRGPLHRHPWRARGPEHVHASRCWPRGQPRAPRWARASVFKHHGQALRVMESFSPHVVMWRP